MNFDEILKETIFIAEPFQDLDINHLSLSVRLHNTLQRINCKTLGDLHGKDYQQIFESYACGRKTILELFTFLNSIQSNRALSRIGFDKTLVNQRNFILQAFSLDDFESNKQLLQEIQNKVIRIPEAAKNVPIIYFDFSARLENVLQRLGAKLLGDLDELSFNEIENTRYSGRKTVEELREFIAKLQDENYVEMIDKNYQLQCEDIQKDNVRNELIEKIENSLENQPDNFVKNINGKIFVPQSVKEIPIKCFALSVRLGNVFEQFNINLLSDLEAFSVKEIKQAKNCGAKTRDELQSFIVRFQKVAAPYELPEEIAEVKPTALDLNGLLKFINNFMAELPDREQEILLKRFGGTPDEKVLTLEEIGEKLNVTRERVRQIESKNVKELKSRLTSISDAALEKLKNDCAAVVCPLTAQFLIHLTGNEYLLFEYPPNFYLHLINILSSGIPVFYENQTTNQLSKNVKQIARQIKNLLDEQVEFLPLTEVYNYISRQNEFGNLVMKDFFEAIQVNNFIIEPGDSADVLLIATDKNRLTMNDIARQVLEKSEFALKPEEIIKQATEMFGAEIEMPSAHSLANLPGYEQDFYLLDSRTIGLRKHFRLPEENWKKLQDDVYELLKNSRRPVSTTEVLAKRLFDWTEQTTASEATEILREDARFKDLGRFLFALTEWEIEERVPVKDLVVRVLEETDDALTATEIGERIQKYRSITLTSMSTILRGHTEIKTFGFGYYGLKSKGNYREFFATSDRYLKRLVKNFSPITFGDLCEKLNLSYNEELADKTWQTLQTIGKLRFSPGTRSAETVITFHLWQKQRQQSF